MNIIKQLSQEETVLKECMLRLRFSHHKKKSSQVIFKLQHLAMLLILVSPVSYTFRCMESILSSLHNFIIPLILKNTFCLFYLGPESGSKFS